MALLQMLALSHCAVQFDWHKNGNFQILAKLSTEHQCQFKKRQQRSYLSRMGLSQWVQTISMVSWVIGGTGLPHPGPFFHPAGNHSPVFLLLDLSKSLPHLTPTRASTPPTQQEHRGPVFILAINLSLPSGLPRATKRARLGLPTLPPPIRKPRLLRVAAARGVTSQKRGWRWWRRTGREEPRMLPQHLRSPATLSPTPEAKNSPHTASNS